MIGTFGIWELVIVLVIILIIFGVGKLPEIGKGLGRGIKEFKNANREPEEIEGAAKDEDDRENQESS